MSEMPPENDNVLPPDPWVNQDMMPMARTAHDLFVAFQTAGFNENNAIQIVTGVVVAVLMGSGNSALCAKVESAGILRDPG